MINSREKLLDTAKYAVKRALDEGADEAAVEIDDSRHQFCRFARNRIIQTQEQHTVKLSIAAAVGKKECTMTISDLRSGEIDTAIRRCVANARLFVDNEEHLSPVNVGEHRTVLAEDKDILDLKTGDLVHNVGLVCERAGNQQLEAYGTHGTFHGVRCIVNSSGTAATHAWTKLGASLTLKSAQCQGSGREEHDTFHRSSFDFDTLYERARKIAIDSCHPREIEPGDYTVILMPQAAAAYIGNILYALDARMIDEGRSVFSYSQNGVPGTAVGRPVFSDSLTVRSVVDHPQHPVIPFNPAPSFDGSAGQGATMSLFSNGLPTENITYIRDGAVVDQFYSYYWAVQSGRKPLGRPSLILFDSSKPPVTTEEMIATTERGILVSSMWYIRFVDQNSLLLTGLTRDGAFLIEDGKITAPIKNLRFNESPFHSLRNTEMMGVPESRRLYMLNLLIPAMKIRDFTFSSVSDAV